MRCGLAKFTQRDVVKSRQGKKVPALPYSQETVGRVWIANVGIWDVDTYEMVGGEFGEPEESPAYTVAELKQMGMVGIYRTSDNFMFTPKRRSA